MIPVLVERLFPLLVRLSTFNVLYSLYFFVSHRSHKSHRERIVYSRLPSGWFVHRSPFTIHRSSFFTFFTLYTFLSHTGSHKSHRERIVYSRLPSGWFVHRSPFTVHRSSLTVVCCLLSVVCLLSLYRIPFMDINGSFVVVRVKNKT